MRLSSAITVAALTALTQVTPAISPLGAARAQIADGLTPQDGQAPQATAPAKRPALRRLEELLARVDPLGGDADFGGVTMTDVPLLPEAEANARLTDIARAASLRLAPATGIDVAYFPSQRPELAPVHEAFERGRYLDHMLGVVDRELALPTTLRVVMADCGQVNAAYLNGRGTLVVCHEVVASFVDQFRPRYANDPAGLGKAVVSATVFTTLHEVGHALVELLRLPILGNEEDAADRIAAVYLLRDPDIGADRALAAADATGAMASIDWDTHPMGTQRRYNIMCLALGALNDPRLSMVGEDDFNKNRLPGCASEHVRARESLDRLLAPHYRWKKQSSRLDALLLKAGPPSPTAPLAPPTGWKDAFHEGLAHHRKVLEAVSAIVKGGGTDDDVALWMVRYIQANQATMASLRSVLTGLRQDVRQRLATDHIFEAWDLIVVRKDLYDAHRSTMELPVVRAFFDLVPIRW